MRAWVLAVLAACAPPPGVPRGPADEPGERPPDQTRYYAIWLGGARVGTATEQEQWTTAGVRLHRVEALRFLRGDTPIAMSTAIDIDADPMLHARAVRWRELGDARVDARRDRVGEQREASAVHGRDGWRVSSGVRVVADATPAELVPLIVRRDGRFAGPVFLPARGFVGGDGWIDPIASDRLVARLSLTGGALAEATIDLDRDRMPARVVDGEGVIAIRISEAQAAQAFPAADLIAATAIAIGGTRTRPALVLDGELALPPVPGQAARVTHDGVEVSLGAGLAGDLPATTRSADRTAQIVAVVALVRARITPDLGAAPHDARDASAATAGDCTTFALAYAATAAQLAIPTRVVTGLRVDRDRLIRHRWAVSWTGTRWIAVDAAFGAAPAGGDLIGLAVHDADDAGLVTGEAALTQVVAASWAR